jgi:prepilin-type N-terminal cleavage/methylation domain-containing protein
METKESFHMTGKQGEKGFSLPEVAIVVAIGLIVTAVGVPRMNNVIGNMKLRSSMTTASGFLQNTRMLAVKKNTTMTARNFNRTSVPYSLVYYVKEAPDTSGLASGDSQVEMEAPINPFNTPTGAGAPAAISDSALGVSTTPQTGDPSFNSRGLPCAYDTSTGNCLNGAFIKYFKDDRISSSNAWAAISISPAGRIKRWFWNGSAWTD